MGKENLSNEFPLWFSLHNLLSYSQVSKHNTRNSFYHSDLIVVVLDTYLIDIQLTINPNNPESLPSPGKPENFASNEKRIENSKFTN